MTTTAATKQIDKSVVRQYAEDLMTKNGSTTTLDVKNALRLDGFYAEQNEVSKHMRTLCSELNWDYTNSGSYNTYSLPTVSASSSPSSSSSTGSNSSSSTATSKDVIDLIEELFKIHKYAMSDKSRIGTDLGLTTLQIEDLALAVEQRLNQHVPANLKSPNTTIGEIQSFLNGAKSNPASNPARVKVDLQPKQNFSGNGASNKQIQDMVSAGQIDDNDWVLSLGSSSTRMVYDGNETRDHVRTAYAREMKDRIQNTRARRAKNLLD